MNEALAMYRAPGGHKLSTSDALAPTARLMPVDVQENLLYNAFPSPGLSA
jgi:hypothetical protein